MLDNIANTVNSLGSSVGGYLLVPTIANSTVVIHALQGVNKPGGQWAFEQGGQHSCGEVMDFFSEFSSDCGYLSPYCSEDDDDGTLSFGVYVVPNP
jgi:hypothetical protein